RVTSRLGCRPCSASGQGDFRGRAGRSPGTGVSTGKPQCRKVSSAERTGSLAVGGVFVNYRTRDGDWAARLTAQELSAQLGPEQVFFAGRSIPPGDDFVSYIEQRLAGCGILLAIIGRQWLQVTDRSGTRRRLDDPEDWVRREIRLAFEHNVRIIPVLLDGIAPLQESDLPDDIAALARRQYLRLDYRDEMDIAALVEEVRRL